MNKNKTVHQKLAEMQAALRTIKCLMPEVEAELSLMGGVGAALKKPTKKQTDFKLKVREKFYKTRKVLGEQ